jgi:thiol:disulfide interchange protein
MTSSIISKATRKSSFEHPYLSYQCKYADASYISRLRARNRVSGSNTLKEWQRQEREEVCARETERRESQLSQNKYHTQRNNKNKNKNNSNCSKNNSNCNKNNKNKNNSKNNKNKNNSKNNKNNKKNPSNTNLVLLVYMAKIGNGVFRLIVSSYVRKQSFKQCDIKRKTNKWQDRKAAPHDEIHPLQ